jgi:hypothetical protein
MDPMSEMQDRLLRDVGNAAHALIAAEREVDEHRRRLHEAIQAAGDPDLPVGDRSGPSAIARASHHRYTREYIGELLKKAFKA